MPFTEISRALGEVRYLEPRVYGDERGFFYEFWNARDFSLLGIDVVWVQDNHSRSAAGVLRGLHFQRGAEAQDKLIRVISGRAWDVVVDVRRSSPTFGQWASFELSAANKRMLFIPKGFAHGFLSLEDGTECLYKCSAFYSPPQEGGIRWDDPSLAIPWPLEGRTPILSPRDQKWPFLSELSPDQLF